MHGEEGYVLSKERMRGLGSKLCWAGPDRRFTGTAVSARESIKSRTMKSLLEKSSREKLGPLGKRDLAPDPALSMTVVGGRSSEAGGRRIAETGLHKGVFSYWLYFVRSWLCVEVESS
jgi:hypothetical protein